MVSYAELKLKLRGLHLQLARDGRSLVRAGVAQSAEAYTGTGNGVTPRSGKPVLEPAQWDGGFVANASQLYRTPAQGVLPMAPNRLRLFSGTANPVSTWQKNLLSSSIYIIESHSGSAPKLC